MPSRYRECSYPGCHSAALRGSQEISTWREIRDATGARPRRVLLCPEHASAWDAYVAARYEQQYGGEPDGPVLHH